nr:unnamed protein product [Digitaria exilis]
MARLQLLHVLVAAIAVLAGFTSVAPFAEAYDPLDPTGNITIKWDIMQWTSDGYVVHDTGMLWGIKYYNDLLMVAGPDGNVQSELLYRKDPSTFTFEKGWAFPRRIYFNGDSCVMPPPDAYPWLPNSSPVLKASSSLVIPIAIWTAFLFVSLSMY